LASTSPVKTGQREYTPSACSWRVNQLVPGRIQPSAEPIGINSGLPEPRELGIAVNGTGVPGAPVNPRRTHSRPFKLIKKPPE
jgi:hypothetical protein